MQQISVHRAPAKIDSFTPRAELHGEEKVPAGSLRITLRGHSSLLDMFDKSYRPFLFRKADKSSDQPSILPGDDMTALSKPSLKSLSLKEEFPGYTVRIGVGLDTARDIVLTGSKLSAFQFTPIAGGSAEIEFSVAAHPDEEQAGRLYLLVQRDVDLTLEPPTASEQMPLGGAGDTLDQQEREEETADAGAGEEE